MVALIFLLVAVVLMLKVAELAPTGTVTLGGTTAFVGLLLVTETTTGVEVTVLRVTVPTELDPPTTVFGFKLKDSNATGVGAGGLTVNVADFVMPA
jgi:hypothetical protein